jgi:hypothetical protein
MTANRAPRAPQELAAGGKALWDSVQGRYELEPWETGLLLEACRTQDRLDAIAAAMVGAPLTLVNQRGDVITNPLVTESRQQAGSLAKLLATLKLPTGADSEAVPARRRNRGGGTAAARGARGSYGLRTVP